MLDRAFCRRSLKATAEGLNIAAAKLLTPSVVLLTAHRIIGKVLPTMIRMSSALVVIGVAALMTALQPALAAAPIPEVAGAAVPTLAPMLARITPGVVNIAV